MAASIHGRLDVVESLIQAGADVDKAANDGITAPMLASEQGHGAIVQAPFQAGADVDKAANDGIDTLYRVANFFCHTNIQINIPLNISGFSAYFLDFIVHKSAM
jgi:ankyrin repeat protein